MCMPQSPMKRKAPTTTKSSSRPRPSEPVPPDPERVKRARRLYRILATHYPDAHCELVHRNPFELLVATILSAQCTDVRVNQVTPALFDRYPTPTALADADPDDVETLIHSTGFYRNKAKALLAASRDIAGQHGGRVPDTMEDLLRLHGVARKTANVVLGNAYDIQVGVVVDTHVGRLARRLDLSSHQDPTKVERDLMALFPRRNWCQLSHLLIFHGRRTCGARKAQCGTCPLRKDCPRVGVDQD